MDENILTSTDAEVESQTEGMEDENAGLEDEDGWDAISWPEDETDSDDKSVSEEPEADQPKDDAAQEPEKEAEPAEEQPAQEAEGENQPFELKYMGETKKVSLDEAKALAQKGMDYDRIRGERDSMQQDYSKLKRYEEFLNELKGDFKDIESMMLDTRARMLAEKEKISYADAVAKVGVMHGKDAEKPAAREDQARGKDDDAVHRFIQRYPNVKAEEIPATVWDEAKQTGDLAGAYARYEQQKQADEIASLKKEIATLKQNQKNAARSAGSAKSAGNTSGKSLIQQLWEEDDD